MVNVIRPIGDPRPYLQQGLKAAHAGDVAEARRCFQAALEIEPDNIVALLWLAWLAPSRRESLALFCRVLKLDPDNKRARAGIEWVHSHGETGAPPAGEVPARRRLAYAGPASAVAPISAPAAASPAARAAARRAIPRPSIIGRLAFLGRVFRRSLILLVTLAIILLLTLFGLIVAERGRERVPAEPLAAAAEAVTRAAAYVAGHPDTYRWQRQEVSAFGLVAGAFARSGGLLALSLALAGLVGIPLGVAAAYSRRGGSHSPILGLRPLRGLRGPPGGAPLVLLLSTLGVSTPSFLLAMLLGVLNIQAHLRLGVDALPPTGFGWDAHMIMPALVLAARPLAQIVQITYVTMSDILNQDYIRVAQAKGLRQPIVLMRHALRNALVPILTTLSTSLRLSLASLPVVEAFFLWPGVGLTLLQAIELGIAPLVADLIVALGLLFLLVNLALDMIYPALDPRLGESAQSISREAQLTWRERLADAADTLRARWGDLRRSLPGAGARQVTRKVLEGGKVLDGGSGYAAEPLPATAKPNRSNLWDNAMQLETAPASNGASTRRELRIAAANPTLLVGMLLVVTFFGLAVFGGRLAEASPYETHGVMTIDGEIGAPPFPPSGVFPWGADHLGRDVKALVLAGARQTLALALFATLARVLIGTLLGLVAGWWRDGRVDRLVTGAVGVWAAFPVTLFAIIVIQALDIQKGMSVFIVALCVVGWAEIAQFVRGQVIGIKPQLHIEAARAIGARAGHILGRHVLPLLLPSLLVLAVLEMGGVLMLLAELGFLNTFLGGGFKVQIAEIGRMEPVVAFYSDVPEWGALLANIRGWWRAYPWLAWYPGMFFFLAILAFNLWGEGLRRWLEQSRVNVSRLFNRYSLAGVAVVVFGLIWVLRSTAPLGVYSSQADQFDAQRALEDMRVLSSAEFEGRETGTPGARRAAEYVAGRMKEMGLQPAGQQDSFVHSFPCPRPHLAGVPRLEILDGEGNVLEAPAYREDFAEYVGLIPSYGEGEGPVVGLHVGPDTGPTQVAYLLADHGLNDKLVILRQAELERMSRGVAGILLVVDEPAAVQRKYLFLRRGLRDAARSQPPIMLITEELAERLLETAGSSLAEFDRIAGGLRPGEIATTGAGARLRASVAAEQTEDSLGEECYNVVGFIPGTGAQMQSETGRALNSQVIMVDAHYDGLGVGPDGTLYAGANDNASGVAAMLEMARVLKHGAQQPEKTVVFVASTGAERGENTNIRDLMNAKIGFDSLNVEVVLELNGLAAGDGKGLASGDGSSYRLVQLFQAAADRMGASTTTRGRGPHYDMYTAVIPGSRSESILPLYISWDGSDRLAHTPEDTMELIDPEKLEQAGQTTLLTLTVLSRETEY
jgi:peptide/nickel transport system permease protein